MNTSLANKLIILRDKAKLSQQSVADYLGISKSTYCRYEKGTSEPCSSVINKLLELYSISYEDFSGISLPLTHTLVYPKKLLNQLEEEISKDIPDDKSYEYYRERYYDLKSLIWPLLDIQAESMNFPSLNLKDLPDNTTLKVVSYDQRSAWLIDCALRKNSIIYEKMDNALRHRLM